VQGDRLEQETAGHGGGGSPRPRQSEHSAGSQVDGNGHIGERAELIEPIQRELVGRGVAVKLLPIPEAAQGVIPFARVIHAKYMAVDGERFWIGTSNWSRGYFFKSRNVGVIGDDRAIGAALDRFFATGWNHPDAVRIEQDATYDAPRIRE